MRTACCFHYMGQPPQHRYECFWPRKVCHVAPTHAQNHASTSLMQPVRAHKIKIICTEALLSINRQHITTMYIVKRDGRQQSCQFDKIQSRISKLCYGLDQKVRVYDSYDGACEKIICHDMMYLQLLTICVTLSLSI